MRIRHDTRTGHWHRNWKSCQLSNPLSWPLWLLWRAIIPGAVWCWWHGPHPPRWSPGITTSLSLWCTMMLVTWSTPPQVVTRDHNIIVTVMHTMMHTVMHTMMHYDALWCWLHGPTSTQVVSRGHNINKWPPLHCAPQMAKWCCFSLPASQNIFCPVWSLTLVEVMTVGSRHRHLWRCTKRKRESWPANVGLSWLWLVFLLILIGKTYTWTHMCIFILDIDNTRH